MEEFTKIEDSEKIEKVLTFEVMQVPEIMVQEKRNAQLLSLLLRAENSERGETETPLAIEISEYFKNNPIDPRILKTIRVLYGEGIDE
jgi:hypothetical protein